jgi:hypothetical protein
LTRKKSTPSWADVKGRLTDLDRAGWLSLLQDLHAASKDNQVFKEVRDRSQDMGYGVGDDIAALFVEHGGDD